MASDTPPPESANGAPEGAAPGQRQFLSIVAQYIKDLSFESPNSPEAVLRKETEPHGDVTIRVTSHPAGEDRYEVMLEVNVKASTPNAVVFLIELVYAGVFTLRGFDDELLEIALMVECPRILFPFARHVIYDTVRDGGFPPLMISPINFLKLYQDTTDAGARPASAKT